MCTKTLVKTVRFLLFSLLISFQSFAQPTANFSATPVAGCAPLLVNFKDNSTGNPTSWRWNLGNGTISFLQNPSVAYFDPGQYTVKLVVKNAAGTDSVTKTQFITVYAKPTVNFFSNTITGCTPLDVTFNDLSTPGSGTLQSWQWDLGDGSFSNDQHPQHTYTTTGNFNVSVLVKNSFGCSETVTKSKYIKILDKPVVDFTNSEVTGCGTPQKISFNNKSTDAGQLTYKWHFGDGSVSNEKNPVHTYTKSGSFTVKLLVTNETGCTDSMVKRNAFTIQNINTGFTANANICANIPLTITNQTSPEAAITFWDFGDGTTSNELTPVKSYTKPGIYQIKLVNNFGACVDSITKSIVINDNALADFTADHLSSCQAPLLVNFTNTSTNATSFLWNFGDGTTSTEISPSHNYTKQGNFTVTLTATSGSGCKHTVTKNQYINIQFPVASISNLPAKGCAPLDVAFKYSVVGGDSVISQSWNFGDNTTSTLEKPTHTFAAGVYDITLVIATASGCVDTVVYKAGVKAGIRPKANFEATPRDVCAEIPVIFTNLTTPSGTSDSSDIWKWEFGDGGKSDNKNPEYKYQDTGYFDVQLIAENKGCADTIKILDYIHITPPIARFKSDPDCISKSVRVFKDESIGADSWSWDFGDNSSSNEQNPVHTYAAAGNYTVSLTVKNNTTGCEYTKVSEVKIIIDKPDFKASDTVICRDNAVTFTPTASASFIKSFNWNFGDNGTGTGNPGKRTYYFPGIYSVRLITVDDNGCKDTIFKPQYIKVNGPTAKFDAPNKIGCITTTINFTDRSVSDGRNGLKTWIWSYGDGQRDTLSTGNASHVYSKGGTYTVQLKVIDSSGCSHQVTANNLITIQQPKADFNTTDTLSCPDKIVTFTNISTGTGLSYTWDFGDGNTSTATNPKHTFTRVGAYFIKLNIRNSIGCTDSIAKVNYMNIQYPIADFAMSDSIGTCPPLIVKFTNNSQYYTSMSWDFGDATNSTAKDPSHFYATAGTYIAKLTLTGPGGCVMTKERKIIVKGPSGSFTYGGLSGCSPYGVNFKATTKGTDSYVWDFNDGNTNVTKETTQSHTYTIAGFYVPKMILRDTAGCVVPILGKDTIRVYDVTTKFDFDKAILCDKGTVQFNNNSIANDAIKSYSWNFGDDSTSVAENPSHTYTRNGVYYPSLLVTTEHGCKETLKTTTPIKVSVTPKATITQSANGCVDLNVTFSGKLAATDTAAILWNWDFGNGATANVSNPAVQNYKTAGTYPVSLTVENSFGCKSTTSATVEAYAIPAINVGTDLTICKGKGGMITATGGQSYQWYPAYGLSCTTCANPIANPDSAITYYVSGKSAKGCVGIDSINVSLKYPFKLRSTNRDTLCLGESMRLAATGAESYSWTPTAGLDDPNSATPTATPNRTTVYRVVGSDEKNCFTDTSYVPLVVYNIPTVDAGADRSINVGQTIDIVPQVSSDVIDARWSPSGGAFRSTFPGITVKPVQTTTYTVEVFNQGGCTASDNITVNVLCDGANIFMPNTFSPNGDGMNDLFYPRGSGVFSIKTIKIFTRWGEVVFEKNNFLANDASKGWDGTFKGTKLNSDVFVYIVDVLCDNNSLLTFKGNVALLK